MPTVSEKNSDLSPREARLDHSLTALVLLWLLVSAPLTWMLWQANQPPSAIALGGGLAILGLVGAIWAQRHWLGQPVAQAEVTLSALTPSAKTGLVVQARAARDMIARMDRDIHDLQAYHAALDHSTIATILTNEDQIVTYINAAAVKLLALHEMEIRHYNPDFHADAMVGTRADLILPTNSAIADARSTGASGQIVLEHRLATGVLRALVSPVFDARGNKLCNISEWSDATEQRRNSALIDILNKTQLRIDLNPEARIDFINDHFARLLDESPEALKGQSISGRILHDGTPVCELMLDNKPINGAFILTLPDGSERHLEGAALPILDNNGKMFLFTLLAFDRTEVQAAEARAKAERADMAADQQAIVGALGAALARLSEGDLAERIEQPLPEDYEALRDNFNTTLVKLRDAIGVVRENAASIRSEAAQMSGASDDLAQRTEKQAATLEETAAALNQLTASVAAAAKGAEQANDMVESARKNAETSGGVVREAVQAMSEIEQSSNKISKITSVIDEIAFQTNLLALNAGVEAARAGEAGRGFAVVASEVRALAQRSSDAAHEIAGLIASSSEQVRRGVGLVGQAGEALNGIQSSVQDILGHVVDIASSTREQSTGLTEINSAMHQLDQVTQQNAAMFEEALAISQSLNKGAEELNSTMAQFRLGPVAVPQSNAASPTSANETMPVASGLQSRRTLSVDQGEPGPGRTPSSSDRMSALAVKTEPDDADWEDF